jgi:UDP-N-acetylmuramoyl-tripeptide--D-alanyl-D-alanine ligase
MACRVTIAQLSTWLAAPSHSIPPSTLEQPALGITTDTRSLKPGEVFLALRGETFDGHQFLATALAQGAIAAIVDHAYLAATDDVPADSNGVPYPLLAVPNTLQAYQTIAQRWRQHVDIPVIGVTGSVGKTTTKELIAAVLGAIAPPSHRSPGLDPILKSQANFNNEIGLPKTLLELDRHHRYAIVEMGMRGPGEIALLSQIAQPDIAVITNVGTAHIGRLGSESAISAAKCELLAEMPADSVAILNHDNPLLLQTAQSCWAGRTLTYGLEGGDLRGELVDAETLLVKGVTLPLPLPGRHNALNYLAALAVAETLGLDWQPLSHGLQVELPGGRAKRIELPGDVVLLDETYNAGLESMIASLQMLAQTPGQRHIAVLGTMKELGDRSPEFHHRVGEQVQQLQLDHLLVLADGLEATALCQGAGSVPTVRCSNAEDAVQQLQRLMQPGDRILFKASRAVGLDRVVQQVVQQGAQQGVASGSR